jgi:hypothetical protein
MVSLRAGLCLDIVRPGGAVNFRIHSGTLGEDGGVRRSSTKACFSADGIDAGYVPEAFVFVIAVWTYPISVAAACFGRRRVTLPVFLPITNLLGIAATRQFAGK